MPRKQVSNNPNLVAGYAVSRSAVSALPGATVQFAAQAVNRLGSPLAIAGRVLAVTIAAGSGATLSAASITTNAQGIATVNLLVGGGATPGTVYRVHVVDSAGLVGTSANLTVVADTVPNSILIPSTLTLATGTSQLSAAVKNAGGTTLPTVPTGWTTTDPLVATVANGLVTAVGAGTATIRATLASPSLTSNDCVVTVTAVVGGGGTDNNVAAIRELLGPMVDVADMPIGLADYEARWSTNQEAQWTAFGSRWDAGNSNAGYDRASIYYAWYARTGNAEYLTRANAIAKAYRDDYLIAKGTVSPHWSQVEGVYLHWLITGEAASRDAIMMVAYIMQAAFGTYIDDTGKDWLDNRIQARTLIALWMAERIAGKGSIYTGQLDSAITKILAMQNAAGFWGFISTCFGSWNFMGGMLADTLTRLYDRRGGTSLAGVPAAVERLANYFWSTQWRPGDACFNYVSLECMDSGGPTPAPDLNGLMSPVFGWLYKHTGDPAWATKVDAILAGMSAADVELYKQFSESYTSSYRTIGYRYGA